jgi:hypothetical protein
LPAQRGLFFIFFPLCAPDSVMLARFTYTSMAARVSETMMNKNSRGNDERPEHSARLDKILFDKMDVDDEWAQRREYCQELAEMFELDIHDCSVNEMNR